MPYSKNSSTHLGANDPLIEKFNQLKVSSGGTFFSLQLTWQSLRCLPGRGTQPLTIIGKEARNSASQYVRIGPTSLHGMPQAIDTTSRKPCGAGSTSTGTGIIPHTAYAARAAMGIMALTTRYLRSFFITVSWSCSACLPGTSSMKKRRSGS